VVHCCVSSTIGAKSVSIALADRKASIDGQVQCGLSRLPCAFPRACIKTRYRLRIATIAEIAESAESGPDPSWPLVFLLFLHLHPLLFTHLYRVTGSVFPGAPKGHSRCAYTSCLLPIFSLAANHRLPIAHSTAWFEPYSTITLLTHYATTPRTVPKASPIVVVIDSLPLACSVSVI
jgi:hypothetical protein